MNFTIGREEPPPITVPEGARAEEVGPVSGAGATIEEAFTAALGALAGALAAARAGPPHLAVITIGAADPDALSNGDQARLELLYREALGGNFCPITVNREDIEADRLTVSAVAVVPPMPSGPVYREMDPPALNYAYSARAQVPDHMRYLTGWRREGAAFRAERLSAEIAYGDGPGDRLDLYMPAGAMGGEPPPLHLFIHGGYWQALDKADHGHFFAAMLEAGIAVALPNYDLLPVAGRGIDDLTNQCRAAVRALWTARDTHGYAMERLTVSGHSAGGQLGAMLAATDWPALDPDLPADLVKGAVLVSGLYDLEPVSLTGINHAVGMDREAARRNSPVHLAPAHALPLLVAVGGDESLEFQRQSREFAEIWGGRGVEAEYLVLDGLNHFTALEALGDPASELGARTLRLIAAL